MSAAFLYQLRKRLQKNSARRKQTIPRGTSSTGPEETTASQIDLTSTSTGDLDEKSGHRSTKNKSTGSNLARVTRNRYVKPGITLIGLVLAMHGIVHVAILRLRADHRAWLREMQQYESPVWVAGSSILQCRSRSVYICIDTSESEAVLQVHIP